MSEWIISTEDIDDITGGGFTVGQKLVRCKDCKWFKEFTNNGATIGHGCCDNPSIRMAKCPQIDWFCADGERKVKEE